LRGWEWRYLWKQTRSDAVFTLCQEPAEIYSLAASPDGQWLAVGSFHPGGLAVWDLRTRRELVRLATNEVYGMVAPQGPNWPAIPRNNLAVVHKLVLLRHPT
jgi:WD40 repeat protein